MSLAILVMLIIIVLNIAFLVIVLRVGTQGEHYSKMSPDQSSAVMSLYQRLGLPQPGKSETIVQEHAKDVANTIDPDTDVPPTEDEGSKEKTEPEDAVAKFANGDDSASISDQLAIDPDEAKEEIDEIVDDVKKSVSGDDD